MNKRIKVILLAAIASLSVVGCSSSKGNEARVMRVAHNQGEEHPIHLALKEFEKIVEDKTNNEIDIQVYPNELLGGQRESVELTQTGAIDIAVGSISLLESFNKSYSVFNLPYLFNSKEHYHSVMNDKDIMGDIYESTRESGFVGLTWFDAGSRNMYTTDKPVMKPEDLKGKKIRVQQSQTNIRMMELLGGSATPMSFGEVYTALQQKVIDGAENNELALTNNKHGEVAKYYSYNQHGMIPDILIMNAKLLDNLSEEHRNIILDAADEINKFQVDAWEDKVSEAVEQSKKMGVKFYYPDIEPFKEKVLPLHKEMTENDKEVKVIYDKIQAKAPTSK
ncbi:TRAP transporter substrate-binding protein [Romboutsia sp. 1001713B170131_170501_G6]|uniref:TRAP transporter substrate-binding protein n=1 Tax=Romboutsia sp. 1001713B170131_170501_G6 TaxID=2787108 RepID=UPI0018A91A81|nr:TRAP transporter substrate-binding protein [Romboutsia sp. 1001713B170131_170501_G6]